MTPRRKLTTLDRLKIMVRQAICPECQKRLGSLADCEFDHQHQLAMDGNDDLDNLFAKHVNCHKAKTVRDAKARAKVRHISKKADRFKALPTGADVFVEAAENHARMRRKKPWPAQKLQSRPFPKREARV